MNAIKLIMILSSRADLLLNKGNPFSDIADWPIGVGGGSRTLSGTALTVTFGATSTTATRPFNVKSRRVYFISYTISNMTGNARILISDTSNGDAGQLIGATRSADGSYQESVTLSPGTYYFDLNKLNAGSADFSAVTIR